LYQRVHFIFFIRGLIDIVFKFSMDICLTNIDNKSNKSLIPLSIHGMLWLQTHFENEEWKALSENKVIISESDSNQLMEDANSAGIEIQSISEVSILDVLLKSN